MVVDEKLWDIRRGGVPPPERQKELKSRDFAVNLRDFRVGGETPPLRFTLQFVLRNA